jgi:tetratricopeptide (TPR) repeat protein
MPCAASTLAGVIRVALLSVLIAASVHAASLDDQLRTAQQLAWQKRFSEAERIYREVLARAPKSRAAALGLGQVLLWEQRYADAADVYRRLLPDAEARKGLATAEYWAGDFRSALRDFALVNDADARKAIADIKAASAPLAGVDAAFSSDDQPLRRAVGSAAYTFFSDPLTTWTASAGTYAFDPHATAPFASVAGSTVFPWQRLRTGGTLRVLRFPDGRNGILGGVNVTRGALAFDVDRHELLYTLGALHNHPSETTTTLAWKNATSQVAVHAIRYFDHNNGRAADAYHLQHVAGPLSLGAAASYRDTDESRFNGTAYDPYWTPQRLAEGRIIAAAAFDKVKLHVDGGWAHDAVNGAFHPWRASADVALPAGATLTMERQSTIFYRATSFHLTIVRRVE